ncbi:MAG TPA: hypothetical protein ENI85_09100 [Deltaproteobacteria bacterium]|nr:hypothetical protein [Deltaproteobacteria bacterium]
MPRRALGDTTTAARTRRARRVGTGGARNRFPIRVAPVLLLLGFLAIPPASIAEPVAIPAAIDPGVAPADRGPSDPDPPVSTTPPAGGMDSARREALETATSPALAELLAVRGTAGRVYRPRTPDEVLTVAVARGPNPELEPKKPFRKRSLDLFRTERRVEIGQSEMLVRLRLRAKQREAMSVELRF